MMMHVNNVTYRINKINVPASNLTLTQLFASQITQTKIIEIILIKRNKYDKTLLLVY